MEDEEKTHTTEEQNKQVNQMQTLGQSNEQESQQNSDKEKEEDTGYVGLSNIGATCYMNSVLQTLFMTPEFRDNIYQWRYNADDTQAEDCIPLQLQILFAKMQLRSFPYVDTKDLAKSFGWDYQDGWEQHDTQEFIRILLDAIEKSFHGSKNYNFINDIYEGTSINYVKCLECNYESITQENFLDLVVTVKNIYDRIYNECLEKAVQRYIKPENLENDNMYMCQRCNKKVNALRGTRFCKLPKILSFIMNRFTFDFSDMKRLKLDDFVSFPFVLNMNEYINGYDNIKNKLSEEVDPAYFKSDYTIKPPLNKIKTGVTTAKTTSTVTTQIKKKVPSKAASSQTRDFLKNLRTQKKFQTDDAAGGQNGTPQSQQGMFIEFDQHQIDKQQEEELQKVIQQSLSESQGNNMNAGGVKDTVINQNNSSAETADTLTGSQNQLNFGPAGPSPDPSALGKHGVSCNVAEVVPDFSNGGKELNEEEQKYNGNHQEDQGEEYDGQSTPNKQQFGVSSNNKNINFSNSKHTTQSTRVNRHLQTKKSSTVQNSQNSQSNIPTQSSTTTDTTNKQQRELSTNRKDQEEKNKQDYKKILAEHLSKNIQESNSLIEKYLKDGPLVYELYSILIHSGGAYGGHYYAYIKSCEDGGKWHSFNDTSIMEIDVNEIPERVFGGNSTNAYMLFYRQWEPPQRRKLKIDNSIIPKDVIDIIEVQKKQWIEQQNWKLEQSKMMSVKVHYILNVKVIQVKSTDTLVKVLDTVIQEFKIKEKRENLRLRRYKPNTDQKLDTFEDIEHLSLDKLKINHFTNLCVEVKKDGEQFEEYDAGTTFVKMVVWKPNIISLEENFLDVIRVSTRRNATIYRLMEQLARAANIDFEKIIVIKKHENIHGINTAEIVSTSQNYDSRLDDMGIMEGQLLFVEEKLSQQTTTIHTETQELKWQEVFESDSNKIFIKFNNPIEQHHSNKTGSTTSTNTSSSSAIIEYNHSLVIDSRQTMEQLKEKIAEQLKIDPVEIIMRRGGKAGIELKEINKTIRSLNFINNSSIYLELGKPAKEGEIRVIFYLAFKTPPNSDTTLHTFEEIGELPIHGNLKASEVKVIACQFLKEKKNIDLNPDFVRLREKISDNLTRIYREKKMREQQVIEKKMIAIEQIEEPMEYNPKDFLIYVRLWDQQSWTLSERFELLVSKTDSGYDLEQKIFSTNQTIPIGSMSAMKINVWNFNLSQLLNSEWYNLDGSDVCMGLHPFHILNDGNMLIIKNKLQSPRELTDEEIKTMGIIQSKMTYKKVGIKSTQQKEKALSIKVKKKESQKDSVACSGKENMDNQKDSIQNIVKIADNSEVKEETNNDKNEQNNSSDLPNSSATNKIKFEDQNKQS